MLFVLLSIQVYGVYTLSVEFSSVSQTESLPLPDLSLPLNFPTSLSSPSTVLWVSERPTTLKPQPRLASFCGSWYYPSHSSDSLEYFGIVFGSNSGEPEYAFPCPLAKLQIAKPLLNPSFLPQRNTTKSQTLSLLPYLCGLTYNPDSNVGAHFPQAAIVSQDPHEVFSSKAGFAFQQRIRSLVHWNFTPSLKMRYITKWASVGKNTLSPNFQPAVEYSELPWDH